MAFPYTLKFRMPNPWPGWPFAPDPVFHLASISGAQLVVENSNPGFYYQSLVPISTQIDYDAQTVTPVNDSNNNGYHFSSHGSIAGNILTYVIDATKIGVPDLPASFANYSYDAATNYFAITVIGRNVSPWKDRTYSCQASADNFISNLVSPFSETWNVDDPLNPNLPLTYIANFRPSDFNVSITPLTFSSDFLYRIPLNCANYCIKFMRPKQSNKVI